MKKIEPFEYADKVLRITSTFHQEKHGSLISVINHDGQANLMTIGWLQLGMIWNIPIATVLVRPSRHTYTCLEQIRQFTVNVMDKSHYKALQLCGTKSGRELDKFEKSGLTSAEAEKVSPPIISEALACYECNVVHYNDVEPGNIEFELAQDCYPQGNWHRLYFGRIVNAYADTDTLEKM